MVSSGLAIASIFGPPRNARTWSGAPASIAAELERRGVPVVGIDLSLGPAHYAYFAGGHLISRYGHFRYSEAIARGASMRRYRARKLARGMKRLGITRVLHTGTLDMSPDYDETGLVHYLLCDHTWHLSLNHRTDIDRYSAKAVRDFENLERRNYMDCRHIFAFGDYVRRDLISHYGVPENWITVVGSGMGRLQPFLGAKDYGSGRLLFIAKHLFTEKGGDLLIDAFLLAVRQRPDLTLTIVGNQKAAAAAVAYENIDVRPYVSWSELESLLGQATLLVQPMLNDPWGQVYLEALISRTPVVGLRRNGLPEIIQDGRFGFQVDQATPEAVAQAILDAVSDPGRLAEMGWLGQRHVLETYSWDRVGQRIFDVIEPCRGSSRAAV